MTKRELIERLKIFSDDIQIYIPFALGYSPIEQIGNIDYVLSDNWSHGYLVLTSSRLKDEEL